MIFKEEIARFNNYSERDEKCRKKFSKLVRRNGSSPEMATIEAVGKLRFRLFCGLWERGKKMGLHIYKPHTQIYVSILYFKYSVLMMLW